MTTLSHKIQVSPSDVREGDVIEHLDGRPAVVAYAGIGKDEHGYYYSFSFGPRAYRSDDPETFVPYAVRGRDSVTKLVPVPEVGDLATLCYPSDRYPFIVTQVSKTGGKIEVSPLAYKIVSGSFQTGDAEVEYSKVPDNAGVRVAYWSSKRGRYTCHGTPVSIGHARFYQAPEV